jgi:hypothetical protein
VQISETKAQSIGDEIVRILRKPSIPLKRFESSRHEDAPSMSPECFRLRKVCSPHSNPKQVGLDKSSEVQAALLDLKHLILSLASRPTHVSELVKHEPIVAGACDEERGLDTAISWRLEWPADVVELCKKGKLTNSDLEMAAVLLQHLVAEQLRPLDQRHVAMWSDNMPTVSWSAKRADCPDCWPAPSGAGHAAMHNWSALPTVAHHAGALNIPANTAFP